MTNVEKWGNDNLVKFNHEKTTQVVISRKHHQDFPLVFLNGHKLDISSSFIQLGLSVSSNLTCKPHINSIKKHASQKLGFLSRTRGYFSPSQLLTTYKSQIRPSMEYCSHVWYGARKSSLTLLDRVQSKAIRLINNPKLPNSLQSLSHRRLVADLSIFYLYFHEHCSQEIMNIIPDSVRRARTTRSSAHSHPFEVALPNPRTPAHKSHSFQELFNCGTNYHSLLSLNPTICHPLNQMSTNLILSPFPLTRPHFLSSPFVRLKPLHGNYILNCMPCFYQEERNNVETEHNFEYPVFVFATTCSHLGIGLFFEVYRSSSPDCRLHNFNPILLHFPTFPLFCCLFPAGYPSLPLL